jgi:hypothetical protein
VPLRIFSGQIIMPGSLKAYSPLLAWRLGTTPAALYERQRALVRDGILEQSDGRGPGSGVQAGPYPVALLLLAVLATDSLSETGENVRILATTKSTAKKDGRCPLTGESTFVEAVARVLDTARDTWRKIVSITVDRTTGMGVINYKDNVGSGGSVFAAPKQPNAQLRAPTRIRINATLTRDLIIDIASDLKKMVEAERRARVAVLDEDEVSQEPPRQRRKAAVEPTRSKKGKKK